jgi:hypothetical protein
MKAHGIGIGKSSTHSLPVHYMETSNDAWSGKEIQTLSCTKVWKMASVNRWHKSHLTLWANFQCQVTFVPPYVFKCPLQAGEHIDY